LVEQEEKLAKAELESPWKEKTNDKRSAEDDLCSLWLYKRWAIRGGHLPTMRADVLEMREVRFSDHGLQAS